MMDIFIKRTTENISSYSNFILLYGPSLTSVHDQWKNHSFDYTDSKVISLIFNALSRFVIAFLPKSKHLLISWLQSLSIVILEPQMRKSITTSTFPLLFAMTQWGRMP